MVATRKNRVYRQDDALYELVGLVAQEMGTNRTTTVEVAVRELSRMLMETETRNALTSFARRIDRERLAARRTGRPKGARDPLRGFSRREEGP